VAILGIYEELGLRKLINAGGFFTAVGGSLMSKEVLEAMNQAAQNFVEMKELHAKAGEIIADIVGAEAAVVTSGAAAGIVLATAACIAGKDQWKMLQLPNTENTEKNEVIVQMAHLIPYAQMVKVAGAKIVKIGNILRTEPWGLEGAINKKTAAIAHFTSPLCRLRAELSLENVLEIAKSHDVPVILDAASELPPLSNLRKWLDMGVDLVISSGGKAIEGPNDTGIIYGRKDLIESCVLQNAPNDVGIGRAFKVSKEQIVGLIVAVQNYANRDHQHDLDVWNLRVNSILEAFQEVPHVKTTRVFPDETGLPVPRVKLVLDEPALGKTAVEIIQTLRNGDPGIVTRPFYQKLGIIMLDVMSLKDGEECIVIEKLKDLIRSKK